MHVCIKFHENKDERNCVDEYLAKMKGFFGQLDLIQHGSLESRLLINIVCTS